MHDRWCHDRSGRRHLLTQPLHVVHIASGTRAAAMFTRSHACVSQDAAVTLVESYIAADGAKSYQAHDALIVAIGDHSRLDHVRLVEDGREAVNISSAVSRWARTAHLNALA